MKYRNTRAIACLKLRIIVDPYGFELRSAGGRKHRECGIAQATIITLIKNQRHLLIFIGSA